MIGVPDPVRMQAIKAVIVLKERVEGTPDLARAIQDFVKVRLAAHEYPRHVAFVSELPMTATGKIIRRVLRKQEALATPMELPPGDVPGTTGVSAPPRAGIGAR